MRLLFVLLLVGLLWPSVTATSSFQVPHQPTTQTTTTGVVIDLTVVDRDGQPVLDLRPEEFELSEDGKRQQILSASLVHAGAVRPLEVPTPTNPTGAAVVSSSPAPRPAAPAALLLDTTPSVTAILFDRLSPEMRPLAHRAALAYVGTLTTPFDYAGVFLANVNLVTYSNFTNRRDLLVPALEKLASSAPAQTSAASERTSYPRVQGLPVDPNQPATAGAESAAGWIDAREREKALNAAPPEGLMRQIELRMYESYQQFLAELDGYTSLAGLRSVVASMSRLPGRKSVLFFCEQLPVTDRVRPLFDLLIREANRHNITFYAVDAAGLRVHSEEARVSRNVELAGGQGLGDNRRGDGPWTKELERQEQILTSRPAAVLGRLANETGGFLLENTNNLAKSLARVQQDRTTYYLLGYQPTNAATDGKFRRVRVKVKRPRVTVRARPGYVAEAAKQP